MATPARTSAIDEAARRIIELETAGSDEPARVAEGVEFYDVDERGELLYGLDPGRGR